MCQKIRLNIMKMQLWISQLATVILKKHFSTKVITANPDKQQLRSIIFSGVEHVWVAGLPHWESANATAEM